MKKLIIVCNMIAIILLLSFVLKLAWDWMMYDTTLNSAPFYIWVVADGVRYLLPAGCTFLFGRFLKKARDKKMENDSDKVR